MLSSGKNVVILTLSEVERRRIPAVASAVASVVASLSLHLPLHLSLHLQLH
jgi:hypothetical protein